MVPKKFSSRFSLLLVTFHYMLLIILVNSFLLDKNVRHYDLRTAKVYEWSFSSFFSRKTKDAAWWRSVRDKTNKAVNTSKMATSFLNYEEFRDHLLTVWNHRYVKTNVLWYSPQSKICMLTMPWLCCRLQEMKIVVHGNQSFHAYFACMIIFFNVPDG